MGIPIRALIYCTIFLLLHPWPSGILEAPGEQNKQPSHLEICTSADDLISSIEPDRMLAHIAQLADEYGIRTAGTAGERLAANYVAAMLEGYGYSAITTEPITLDNGLASRNIYADLPGENPEIILIGAHLDSKPPSPGANDNASGVAVLLELARVFKDAVPPYTIRFAFFGAEEMIDSHVEHHHYGSRNMAGDSGLIRQMYAAASIDMVGVGTELWIDNMGESDDFWRQLIFDTAGEMDLPVHTGEHRAWSDHEAFEYSGVPSAWIHWRDDPEYHRETDTSDRINPDLLVSTVELMIRAIDAIQPMRNF
ncbi:MAG: M28 family metallopeptidase [bacterium]|nr:M28 family metallopeptidase [bacterium]